MTDDVPGELRELTATLTSIEKVLDLDALRAELAELEEQAGQPGPVERPGEHAQKVTSRLSHAQGELRRVEDLRRRLDDLPVLFELAEDEDDAGVARRGRRPSVVKLRDDDRRARGPHAALAASTTPARRWSPSARRPAGSTPPTSPRCCMRMYLRWAERHGYATEVYDTSYAEEAGIKSATFQVKAPYAYGTLSVEQGTHRLVRISPFDNQGRRQTSFAGVEVAPVVETTDHIEIDEKDLRVDVYRSSGPGGQGVNTTDSAVRITHLPTGIVVSCQNERIQIQNRASAMTVLQAKLLERRRQEEQAEMDALKDDGGTPGATRCAPTCCTRTRWSRTCAPSYEVGNPSAVLDGDIDGFIEAGIRWRRSQETASRA